LQNGSPFLCQRFKFIWKGSSPGGSSLSGVGDPRKWPRGPGHEQLQRAGTTTSASSSSAASKEALNLCKSHVNLFESQSLLKGQGKCKLNCLPWEAATEGCLIHKLGKVWISRVKCEFTVWQRLHVNCQ